MEKRSYQKPLSHDVTVSAVLMTGASGGDTKVNVNPGGYGDQAAAESRLYHNTLWDDEEENEQTSDML